VLSWRRDAALAIPGCARDQDRRIDPLVEQTEGRAMADGSDHNITPESVTRLDGSKGNMLNPVDYPLLATCMTCHRRIRCDTWLMGEWVHLPEENPRSSSARQQA
jgi:hypothetical protein